MSSSEKGAKTTQVGFKNHVVFSGGIKGEGLVKLLPPICL